MNYRKLGKTGFEISEVSLGTWQVGGKWGSGFDHKLAQNILAEAIDQGVNFIDTADVYEDGESEIAVGRAIKNANKRIFVATKCGRQVSPHVNEGYTPKVLRTYVEDSLKRLQLDCIDLIQLHCPPTQVFYRSEIFEEFDKLKQEGKILNLGVSVEKVEEAMKAIEFDNVTTVQIIYNMFRQRPQELFFEQAAKRNVGVIVRVPLASGLLTGKFGRDSQFAADDHRQFNRDGAMFDKGETFAGIPYDKGLDAVEDLKAEFGDASLTHAALKWILRRSEVSCVIPGASRRDQLLSNLAAVSAPELTPKQLETITRVYDEQIKAFVHQAW
ncbi:aldo/keto reductase [Gilvimarinus agarilyticus]|uniref:aldo/keto reductase n=1 Tax=Reichenbachiella TaxID=156993 RepID=UPI000E6CB277|nr:MULTISPECIES: aldo/keto reductase [Reichenbachiella]MBU2885861.1 aldo/keto reductase [Gilvimarinus agarilyticus]MBU2915244.1 aldo/keto reductase [Reichenbachiella agariperforans]RJE70906.1 aldo/keto reductase [Reichenbachiella sp. MSK19-1]